MVIIAVVLALIGTVVVGLSSIRRDVETTSKAEESKPAPPTPATAEQADSRLRLLDLCRERLARVGELGKHLDAPVLKTAPVGKWDFDSIEGRQLFENAQMAIAAYVHALIANTEALKSAALKANPDTTYGRKVLEARRLQMEIEKLDLQIANEKKRSGI
ncbi:hypothetical protein BH10BDE1_BH10BDE1_29450 [soil metagenome]